jgi:hypothetical protein
MRILLAVAFLLAGCTKTNPNYCEGAPDNNCPGDGPQECTTSQGACVCLQPAGVCVECTMDDKHNCTAAQPACGSDNVCRECRSNDDCDSGACLETGACASASQIIYAAPGGTMAPGCGAPGETPCSISQAVNEIGGTRNIIRLATGMYTVNGADGLDFNTRSGTLIARGATLTRSPVGPIISVRNNQTLKIVGGTVQGSNGDDGIQCNTGGKLQVHETTIERMDESGIESDGCELTISRATIRANLRGGINMVGVAKVVTITNNLVYRNGMNISSPVGGMALLLAAGSKVEFNTVIDNTADLGSTTAGGIRCDAQGSSYDAPYNLVYRNQGGLGATVQVIGTCTFLRSYQQSATPGDNSIFLENPNDAASPSFRLTGRSPAEVRDPEAVASFDCSNLIDFEGDPRPSPAGGKCDMGADEYREGQ